MQRPNAGHLRGTQPLQRSPPLKDETHIAIFRLSTEFLILAVALLEYPQNNLARIITASSPWSTSFAGNYGFCNSLFQNGNRQRRGASSRFQWEAIEQRISRALETNIWDGGETSSLW
jgi:hypothetical protein